MSSTAEVVGKVWLGTTVVLALADGALPLLILAGAPGYGTYRISRGWTQAASAAIYAETEAALQADVEAAQNDRDRRAAERTLRKELEALLARQALDEEGNGRAAELIGVGAFAAPVIGCAAVAAHVMRK